MPERRIGIVHPNGKNVAVTPELFHSRYEAEGWTATDWTDTGEPYEAPVKGKGKSKSESEDKGE